MTHLSSASITGPGALEVFVDVLLVEELPQSSCENDKYCLKKLWQRDNDMDTDTHKNVEMHLRKP